MNIVPPLLPLTLTGQQTKTTAGDRQLLIIKLPEHYFVFSDTKFNFVNFPVIFFINQIALIHLK
jgi:hypothetical protein